MIYSWLFVLKSEHKFAMNGHGLKEAGAHSHGRPPQIDNVIDEYLMFLNYFVVYQTLPGLLTQLEKLLPMFCFSHAQRYSSGYQSASFM